MIFGTQLGSVTLCGAALAVVVTCAPTPVVAASSLGQGSTMVVAYADPKGFERKSPVRDIPVFGVKGYVVQTPAVKTGCFPAKLRGLIARLGAKFGSTPIITSGYRGGRNVASIARGRKHRGSYHASCMAADIQIAGVSAARVFAAAKSLQGRGGVGIYSHTRSVHLDVGPQREWAWGRARRGARTQVALLSRSDRR